MKRGYLLAAVLFAVMVTLLVAGCPSKPKPGGNMPNMVNMMMNGPGGGPGMNAEAPVAENMEAPIAENAETTIPAPK